MRKNASGLTFPEICRNSGLHLSAEDQAALSRAFSLHHGIFRIKDARPKDPAVRGAWIGYRVGAFGWQDERDTAFLLVHEEARGPYERISDAVFKAKLARKSRR